MFFVKSQYMEVQGTARRTSEITWLFAACKIGKIVLFCYCSLGVSTNADNFSGEPDFNVVHQFYVAN